MANLFKKEFWKKIPKLLMATFNGFSDDKGLKLSASLAYYTIFSIGPLLLLLMSLASVIYGQAAIEGKVFGQLNGLLGSSAAKQIQEIIKNVQFSGKTKFALVISIITLIVGATSLFIEIQDSLNMIWKLKAKPKKGWVAFLKNRLLSSSLIISLGFLLIVTLIVNGVIEALMSRLGALFGSATAIIMIIINLFITFVVITVLFSIIFKFLPDAKIRWKHVRTGAIFTAILFMIGRYLIGLYIQKTGTESTYGAAGSIVIILIWIYYSSVILYLGAEFTQVYTDSIGGHIEPAEYAVHVQQTEVEKEVSVLPAQ
ncbi:MAG: YihY/virulence factor BrkB family protein, partial [Chitinophagaceae bacterium]|nr:YihY/virulence factor BrkB family protein [Chitinophagaceae bacterium]